MIVQAKNIENAGDLPEVGADTDGAALCVAHDGTLRRTLWNTLLAWLQERLNAAILNHAERHASGGADPITPASIGAAAADHTHEGLAKEYLPLNGGDMTGNIDMGNHFLTGLPAPVAPSDAVNFQTLIKAIVGSGIEATARLDYSGSNHQIEKTVSISPKMTVGNTVLFYADFSMSFDQGGFTGSNIHGVSLKIPQLFTFRQGEWSDFGQFSDGPVQLLSARSGGDALWLMPKIVDGEFWLSTNGEILYNTTSVHVSGYFMLDWNI